MKRTPVLAVLVLFAFIAAACGSGATTVSSERDVAAPAPNTDTAPVPTAASAPAPTADATTPRAAPQHGVSLSEWASTVEGSDGASGSNSDSNYPTIEWSDLIPAGQSGADIMTRYEDRLEAVKAGSAQALEIYEEMQAEFVEDAVNLDLDGTEIRLAGFVAPLTYEDEIVTEFLLVPNFGACIHVPPPPPNQTVMVTLEPGDGLTFEEAWGPVWVEGTLTIDGAETVLAEASYTITGATSGVYEF